MDDWDCCSEDDDDYELKRRLREEQALARRFEKVGFEQGLSAIAGEENPQVQASFDASFAAAFNSCYKLGEAASQWMQAKGNEGEERKEIVKEYERVVKQRQPNEHDINSLIATLKKTTAEPCLDSSKGV